MYRETNKRQLQVKNQHRMEITTIAPFFLNTFPPLITIKGLQLPSMLPFSFFQPFLLHSSEVNTLSEGNQSLWVDTEWRKVNLRFPKELLTWERIVSFENLFTFLLHFFLFSSKLWQKSECKLWYYDYTFIQYDTILAYENVCLHVCIAL